MKKIRLDVSALEVNSFSTAEETRSRGTVQGAASGYTCYVTVAIINTLCAAYPISYWHEATCTCPAVPLTRNLNCPIQPVQTAFTCLGQPGC